MKKQKLGISLIVLVITIIVMIILAASVVITLSNAGIINKASDAVDLTNKNEVQNLANLIWADEYMSGKRGTELQEAVLSKLDKYKDKYDITVTDKGVNVTGKDELEDVTVAYIESDELVSGLYDSKGRLLVSWTDLVNEYEFDITKDFVDGLSSKYSKGSLHNVILTNAELASAAFIKLDESVTKIGAYAFYDMNKITPVLPVGAAANNLTYIGDYAFYGTNIEKYNISNDINYIGIGAFGNCNLEEINGYGNSRYRLETGCIIKESDETIIVGSNLATIPEDVEIIEAHAFSGRKNLGDIYIPKEIGEIKDYAFANTIINSFEVDSSKDTVAITNLATDPTFDKAQKVYCDIKDNSFEDASIKTVTVPSIILAEMKKALSGTERLTIFKTAAVNGLFDIDNLYNDAMPITLLSNVDKLKEVSLKGYTSIQGYTTEDGAYGILQNCTNLTTVNIIGNKDLAHIAKNTFKDCPNLTVFNAEVEIGAIARDAFAGCNKLNYTKEGIFYYLGDVIVDIDCTQHATGNAVVIEEGHYKETITGFYANAFDKCNHISTLTIPETVESIPQGMFEKLTNLTVLDLKASAVVTLYETEALKNTNVTEIKVPNAQVSNYKSDGNWGIYESLIKSSSNQCVTGDTMILLANGSYKRIDEIKYDDTVMVWNFETGSYDVAPISIIFYHGDAEYDVTNLVFSDGTVLKTINTHGLYSVSDNTFVYISQENVNEYINKEFIKYDNGNTNKVKLVDYYISKETTGSYCLQTAGANNYIAGNMLSLTKPDYPGWFDYFDISDDMKYDEDKKNADIAKYGLYEYSDLAYTGITYEQFMAFNGPYLKVLVGRGVLTINDIEKLIAFYLK